MWVPTDPFFPCVSFLAAGACPVRELCVSWGWAPPEPPPARGTQRREKRGLLRTDLRPRTAPRGAELPFAPSCGQRSASVVPCQGVFAAGPGAVGSSGSAALSEGAQRDIGPVLALPFGPLHCGAAAFHSPFSQQDKRPFGWFFVLFFV